MDDEIRVFCIGGKMMADPFHVKGTDGIVRALSEHYDGHAVVQQDPYGAWLAIQILWQERERLMAALAEKDATSPAEQNKNEP